MKLSEIYDYLKLNGVKDLTTDWIRIYVESNMIVYLNTAWLNVDFSNHYFSTNPDDTKPMEKVTTSDLDRFISEYKYYYSDDRIRDIKIAKLQSAIMKHRLRSGQSEKKDKFANRQRYGGALE